MVHDGGSLRLVVPRMLATHFVMRHLFLTQSQPACSSCMQLVWQRRPSPQGLLCQHNSSALCWYSAAQLELWCVEGSKTGLRSHVEACVM